MREEWYGKQYSIRNFHVRNKILVGIVVAIGVLAFLSITLELCIIIFYLQLLLTIQHQPFFYHLLWRHLYTSRLDHVIL